MSEQYKYVSPGCRSEEFRKITEEHVRFFGEDDEMEEDVFYCGSTDYVCMNCNKIVDEGDLVKLIQE